MTGRFWRWGVVAVLVGNVAVMVGLVAAAGDADRRVLPGYYRKALAYDQERRASDATGWRGEWQVAADSIAVVLEERTGDPVRGASVSLTRRLLSETRPQPGLVMTEVEPGVYRAATPQRAGAWEVEAVAERHGDRWIARRFVEGAR